MTVLKRLPLTTSLLYLVVGVLLGPFFLGMIQLDRVQQPALLEKATEVAVVISLFTTGLKLRLPLSDKGWRLAPTARACVHDHNGWTRGANRCGRT
jgi:NhaP-type Na+/H+ or K+/H+ antiporter